MNLGERVYLKLKSTLHNIYLRNRGGNSSLQEQLMLKVDLYDELDDETRDSFNEAFKQVYKRSLKENEIRWAKPHWVVFGLIRDKIISFCFIVKANALFDSKLVHIGGVGGVGTLHSHRGLGLAQKLLLYVNSFMYKESSIDFGLLVCNKNLTKFYKHLDWYEVHSKLYYELNDEKRLLSNRVMLKGKNGKFRPKVIEVEGKIW